LSLFRYSYAFQFVTTLISVGARDHAQATPENLNQLDSCSLLRDYIQTYVVPKSIPIHRNESFSSSGTGAAEAGSQTSEGRVEAGRLDKFVENGRGGGRGGTARPVVAVLLVTFVA
jgi:hypothetical protein